MQPNDAAQAGPNMTLELQTSRQFPNFLAEQRISLGVTTYQAGKLFLLGLRPDGRLSVFERTLERCMGLCATADSLHVATLYQIWRFQNVLAPGALHHEHDALFSPRMSWVTGDLDVHDLALLPDGRPIFANTLFSCLATVSDTDSFVPLWKPRFISRLAAEDRCHLNGMAMRDGHPAYVTALATTNTLGGWREHRGTGGVIVDITGPIAAGSISGGEVVATGLSMPHSPRWHDGRLWFCESGTGALAVLEDDGTVTEVTRLPGFTRGLTFIGPYAIVGLSQVRESVFTGLPVTTSTGERNCGAWLVDTRTGATVGFLRFTGAVTEIFDVHAIPDRWPHLADPGELTKSCYALDPATLQHLAPHGGNHQ